MKSLGFVVGCALCLALSTWAYGQSAYESLAENIAAAALKSGAKKAQFLPLAPADGKAAAEGKAVSDRLLKNLSGKSGLAVVVGEQPAPADVLVLGSYLLEGDRVKVSVQVVQSASGSILLAADEDFENDYMPAALPAAVVAKAHKAPKATPRAAAAKPEKAYPVEFSYPSATAETVELSGVFLIHSKGLAPMTKGPDNLWKITVFLTPATYYYSFVIDSLEMALDPKNPAKGRGLSVINVPKR